MAPGHVPGRRVRKRGGAPTDETLRPAVHARLFPSRSRADARECGPGASGPAPQDGSKILLSHALPLVERMSPKGVQFKTANMQWLGAYDAIAQMMVLWHTVPVKTLDELRTGDFVVGSFNKTHLTYQWAMLTKNVLGTNYKVTTGYPSGNHLNLAMERGEVDGRCGWSWSSVISTRASWLKDNKVSVLMQLSLEKHPDLPNVPLITDLAKTDEQRAILRLVFARQALGRPYLAPRGVPAG